MECDAIIHLEDGSWGAIEIKLSNHLVENGAISLKKIAETIDTTKLNNLSFLMVLTGGNHSYKRQDGIYVVSVGLLKP